MTNAIRNTHVWSDTATVCTSVDLDSFRNIPKGGIYHKNLHTDSIEAGAIPITIVLGSLFPQSLLEFTFLTIAILIVMKWSLNVF